LGFNPNILKNFNYLKLNKTYNLTMSFCCLNKKLEDPICEIERGENVTIDLPRRQGSTTAIKYCNLNLNKKGRRTLFFSRERPFRHKNCVWAKDVKSLNRILSKDVNFDSVFLDDAHLYGDLEAQIRSSFEQKQVVVTKNSLQ
jgi:predicted AAA+ superfamily ATPase